MKINIFFLCVLLVYSVSWAEQKSFASLVGPVQVQNVQKSDSYDIPFITWGGDVATFQANGGLKTAAGSTYQKLGLNMNLVKGDDFIGQVKNYMSGKTPFLRGTHRMIGQASEVLGSDSRTKPVIILQLSWSAGDHIVAREGIKKLNDLKGKDKKVKIACQQGGPHAGLLYDALAAAQIDIKDVEVVWVKDITGPNGPAEAFRKDGTIDACCVITPDVFGLSGGIDTKGSGAEGTVKGAHVLVSTQQMSRSIADVYAVRSDFYKENKPFVEKFVAAYLKGAADLVKMRNDFEKSKKMSDDYKKVLLLAQRAFGHEVIPNLEVDAHGLLLDCNFVGLPGQISFFEDRGNLNGFDGKTKAALDMAVSWGYVQNRRGFSPSDLNYKRVAEIGGIEYVKPQAVKKFNAEGVNFFPDDNLDENTIVSFTIKFKANQKVFLADEYGAEFERAVKTASTFGNAAVVVTGHSDPTQTLVTLIRAGMQKGLIKRTGSKGDYKYFFNGSELELTDTRAVIKTIKEGGFDGGEHNPRATMQAALNLSLDRAKAVTEALKKFAADKGLNLDQSQIQSVGAGIMEPIIAKPKNIEQARENMRVEFKIVKVPAEVLEDSDFGF